MQDIRGETSCKICNHSGRSHSVGFFCLADNCCCGHDKENVIHQKHGGVGGVPCRSCDPATTTWKGPTGFDNSDERGSRRRALENLYALGAR